MLQPYACQGKKWHAYGLLLLLSRFSRVQLLCNPTDGDLCNPIDGSPWGSPVPGILQARTLEWVAISFSNAWTWKVKAKPLSHVQLLATSWTAAHQAPPSMGVSRQEHWSGVPFPSPMHMDSSLWVSKRGTLKLEDSNVPNKNT